MNLSLTKQPWYIQLGAFLVLSLGAVAAFYFLYASPASVEAAAKEAKLKSLRADIEKGRAIEGKLKQFNKELKDLEARYEVLKTNVPDEREVAELIASVNNLALHSNLKINSSTQKAVVSQPLYTEIPFDVQLETNYGNFGTFLDQLRRIPRVVTIRDMAITGRDKPSVSSSISVKCVATTYVLKAPGTETPAKGDKGKQAKPAAKTPAKTTKQAK